VKLVLALALVISLASIAYEIHQIDWSGGPGVPGPDHYWYDTFLSETSVTWDSNDGIIYLGVQAARHPVGGGVPGWSFIHNADINGDGYTDIVACTGTGEKHVWFENDGIGSNWAEHIIEFAGTPCRTAFPVDIDGDEDIDVIGAIIHSTVDSILWYENTDGIGIVWERHFIDEFESPYYMCGADIDGDGDNDIVTGAHGPGEISWWENENGSGSSWQKHNVIDYSGVTFIHELFLTDLDLDGDVDILCASSLSCSFFENVNGSGTLWTEHQISDGYRYSVHAGDLDGDGDMDVTTAALSPYTGEVYWNENINGSCTEWEQHTISADFVGANAVRAVDLTGDGYLDVLAAAWGYAAGIEEVAFWENAGGTGTMWLKHRLSSGLDCCDVQPADIDNDGVMDVICKTSGVYWISFEGKDSGNLTSTIRDMWGYPEWQSINWEGTEPDGTDLFFSVRTSNDPDNMGVWSDYIYDPGSLTGFIDSTHRYIQYAVHMETEGLFGTPVLDEISFQFTNLGIEEEQSEGIALLPVTPNPQRVCTSLSFVVSETRFAELAVFDLTGRQVYSISELWHTGEHTVNLPALSNGAYVVRLTSDGSEQTERFVLLN